MILLIALSIFSSMFAFYYFDQVKYIGKLTICSKDLSAQIHIHTDENGFIHIKANTIKDVFLL